MWVRSEAQSRHFHCGIISEGEDSSFFQAHWSNSNTSPVLITFTLHCVGHNWVYRSKRPNRLQFRELLRWCEGTSLCIQRIRWENLPSTRLSSRFTIEERFRTLLFSTNTWLCLFGSRVFSSPGLLRRQWACWGKQRGSLILNSFLRCLGFIRETRGELGLWKSSDQRRAN